MTTNKHAKTTISRRRFLQGAATLGIIALARSLLPSASSPARAAEATYPPAPTDAPADLPTDEGDHHVYLPLVSHHPYAAPQSSSKLGLHTIRPGSAVEFVQGVYEAGAHVTLVKAVDWFGFTREVKTISPETVTIGRWSGVQWVEASGDPAQWAAQVMAQHMPRWIYERDVIDYWEVLNEVDPPTLEGHVWLAQFYSEAMRIADANGYRLAILSYSVGVPTWAEWEAIVETGIFAQAKASGHILALHEYNYPTADYRWGEPIAEGQPSYEDRGVLTGRYRHLYRDLLIPRDEVTPLAITEGGLDPVLWQPGQPTTWKDRLVEEMAWYDERLREDDYVIGVAMFTIGSIGEWEMYDYEALLPDFHEHIVSLQDA